jgi:PAS domain S-box-containing protein
MNGLAFSHVAAPSRVPGALRHAMRAWDGLLELLPIAVYVCDRSGVIVQYNRRAAELWGRVPEVGEDGDRFCGSHRLFFDGRLTPREETPMAYVLRTGQPVHGAEGIVERPDGSRIWAMVHIDPLRDEHGTLVGAINCFHETTEQKRTEEKLREQEQRLAATYHHANIGISEIDAEGRWLRMNETACRIAGGTREELLGQSVFAESEQEANAADFSQFQRLVAGEIDQYTAEHRHLKKTGERIWVSVMCSAVRDKDGKFLYAVRVVDDITESKQMADALAESQMRLAATYEQATIGISEADAEGRLLRVNEASCSLTGFTREELLERPPFFSRMRPEDASAERELYRRQVAGEIDRYTIEKRIRRKDEREIYVSVMSSSVRDRDGKFRYAVRVLQDITERKRAEDRLRASERRLRELLEAMPAAVYTTDAQGRITFFNQAAVEFSGRVPVLGSDEWCVTWRLFYPDGTPMRHDECPMAVALREGRAIRDTEAIAERPDGTRVPFIPYPTPLFDDDGKVVGAINMLVDITDRKTSELHLRTLVDELNHRVKNTLATVQSLARQTARSASSIMDFQTRLQGRLIALSEGHDQLTRGKWEQADLREVLEAALKPYRDEFGARIAMAGDAVKLHPRAALTLSMVFHELITNAAKYGALSNTTGRLSLTWHIATDGNGRELVLHWREEGGPPVASPLRRGFGTQMVERSIPAELGGCASLQFAGDGVICEVKFPLANNSESSPATPERTTRLRRRG